MDKQFLLITLIAPLASFGDIAGHEHRKGRNWPSKSALLGLLGAALGIKREDQAGQQALSFGYDCAVRCVRSGDGLIDYHTAQPVPTARQKKPQGRPQALRALKSNDNVMITRRSYQTDVAFIAAFSANEHAQWSLENIVSALKAPFFTLYLGRKSCPLSFPLNPRLCLAPDILAALTGPLDEILWQDAKMTFASQYGRNAKHFTPYIVLDKNTYDQITPKDENVQAGLRIEQSHDQPIDRQKWHFAKRYEVILPLDNSEEISK